VHWVEITGVILVIIAITDVVAFGVGFVVCRLGLSKSRKFRKAVKHF